MGRGSGMALESARHEERAATERGRKRKGWVELAKDVEEVENKEKSRER
ncbi:MAG: hypothetical protein Q8881_02630 [Sweet potato little leaf phytoplasma]|nr:hypothetical protein [Sweet potato little leaf phytoplasma]